jgi:hypothetical protein
MKRINPAMVARAWSDEWQRTDPDLTVYLPEAETGDDGDNEHFLVIEAPYDGHLLAFWTQGDSEGGDLQRVVCARSEDDGVTWRAPHVIDGPHDDGFIASWGFPVVSRAGRIYCFYNKHTGVVDHGRAVTGVMKCQFSDDNASSWRDGGVIPFGRSAKDHPEPTVPPNWIVWQKPIRDSKGRQMVGFTRHTSEAVRPPVYGAWQHDSQSEFIRFENIDEGPDPADLRLTWLPANGAAVRIPLPGRAEVSVAQEPSLALLPDGRLFCVFRTVTGRIWHSVSDDDGATWRAPEPLRYEDGGAEVLHPISPCPIYRLNDGRYLLLYHNNDGRSGGGTWPGDSDFNRNQAYIAVGEYRGEAHQPIWFSPPKLFCESNGVALGPSWNHGVNKGKAFRIEVATYTSLTEKNGQRILWYPDRKHFLLGRYITDEWLADLRAPAGPSLYGPLVRKRPTDT